MALVAFSIMISKLKKILTLTLSALLILVLVGSNGVAAAGLSPEQKKIYQEGIYYYDIAPNIGSGCAVAGSTNLTGGDNAEKAYNFLVQRGLSPQGGAGVVGNLIYESNLDPTITNSIGAHGIAQWYQSRRTNLEKFALSRNVPVDDLQTQLEFLYKELNNGYSGVLANIKTSTDPAAAATTFFNDFEKAGDDTLGKRIKNAQDVFSRFGGGAVVAGATTTLDPTTGCVGGNGVVAGSIVKTALGLAWHDHGHGPDKGDATPAYQSAMPQYNGATTDQPFSDCGVFVSTVMIASGADPNYERRTTGRQQIYLDAHPELYMRVIPGDVTNSSQLQPGDILINSVHTYIFTGTQPEGFNAVGGALHDHVPQASAFYGGFAAYRFIGKGPG